MPSAAPLVLENETLRLEFSRETGALTGLAARPSGWALLDRPDLGLSFRMLVPLTREDAEDVAFAERMCRPRPERRCNEVRGEQQRLARLSPAADGRSVVFEWDQLVSTRGGILPIRVELQVCMTDRQAVYRMMIENRSPHLIENVYCPYLGDLQHPPGGEPVSVFFHDYAQGIENPLWPSFVNRRGYYGTDYPMQFSGTVPYAPFVLVRTPSRGLYVGVEGGSAELVAWHAELRPGYGNAMGEQVPGDGDRCGPGVCTRFAAVHVPFIGPGETRALTPVALETYEGDWWRGADIYTAARTKWMTPARPPAWAREPHAWLQLHINSPEDELRMPFRELPKVGEECVRHGIRAIQLVGWNDGGQDQGNPSHDPDPRLGTFAELRDAITALRAMGVKLILFTKFTWSDQASRRFRDGGIRWAVKDPYGDYYLHGGYQYQTATQLLNINTRRLVPMCFSSDDYLDLCATEFQKVVDLGADGILFDECQHHSPALLCFDPSHGHRIGAPVYAQDRELVRRLARRLGEGREDFLFAGEACYDWEMEAYALSYFRSWDRRHVPMSRYLLPHAQFMTAICGFNDRHMINQCLMYRYIASYEPYHFKGRPDDFPETMAYGRTMDALRTELRDWFWDGEFRYEAGARVLADGTPHRPYSVFVNARNGKRGLVICNYDDVKPVTVDVRLEGEGRIARWRRVDEPEWHEAQPISLPPRSAAVVLEA